MVASQCLQVNGKSKGKTFRNQVLLPTGLPDSLPEDHVELELDFSDVFGPAPQVPSAPDMNELVYDEPEVICSRSHSLVGPSSFTSQSMKLSKLTLHETEYDLVEAVRTIGIEELEESSFVVNDDDVSGSLKNNSVGLEDFEVLKVVGQGAFAKVYQVRKNGSSEIFAMKVMRKDKIFEQDHAEYMKAERDILTKIDHPFIVQLKYSFQVMIRTN